jgi:hypothetical protein
VTRLSAAEHDPIAAIDPLSPHSGVQPNRVPLIPVERIEQDVVGVGEAAENRRELNPVVVAVRLVAEHRDREPIG